MLPTCTHLKHAGLAALLMTGWAGAVQALVPAQPPIQIDLYSGFVETSGVRIAFSGLAGQLTASTIDFQSAGPWWPLGEFNALGALLTSGLDAPSAGDYTFTLGSDAASYLFIDGQLVLALTGEHAYYTGQQTVALTAGSHVMALQFYNGPCCESRLSLDTGGLAYASLVPEPAAAPLWLGGLLVSGLAWRHRSGAAKRTAERAA